MFKSSGNIMDNLISTHQILKSRTDLKKLLLVASCWLMVAFAALGQTATISVNTPVICQDGIPPVITFTGSGGTGGPYIFNYTIDGVAQSPVIGTPSTATVLVPTASTGVFNYALTSVTDNLSNTVLQSDFVEVTVVALTTITGGHDVNAVSACVGYNPNITLTIDSPVLSGGLGPYLYQWQLNGAAISGETNTTFTPPILTSPGPYSYNCVITDACGTILSTIPKVITIFPDPLVSISGGGNVCLNASVTLTSTVTPGTGAYNYRWESSPTGTDPWTIVYSGPSSTYSPPTSAGGTTYYRLVLEPNVGSCDNATSNVISVTVIPLPVINAPVPTIACVGVPVIFSTESGNTQYSWQPNGTYTITGGNTETATVKWSVSGNQIIRIRYSKLGCLSTSINYPVTVIPPPTSAAGAPLSTCSNSVAFNISASATATNYSSVLWTSSGTAGTLTNANTLNSCTYTPSAADILAGNVTLTLTATGNSPCGNAISNKTLTIISVPTAAAGAALPICSNSVAFNISATASATNYTGVTWSSSGSAGTLTNANTLNSCTYTPSAADITAGSVTLTLTVTPISPCVGNVTSSKTLTIIHSPTSAAGASMAICSNAVAVNISTTASASNYTSVIWTSSGTAGTLANANTLNSCTYTTERGRYNSRKCNTYVSCYSYFSLLR